MDTLLFECVGLKAGCKFPTENTGRGQDVSPEFLIKNLSPAAKTLAVTLEDIRHPFFRNFTHWLIWNIPAAEKIAGAIPVGGSFPAWEMPDRELDMAGTNMLARSPQKVNSIYTALRSMSSTAKLRCHFRSRRDIL
mgnify:CR=1 FL=1